MLRVYRLENGCLKGGDEPQRGDIPPDAIWLDLSNPTADERAAVIRAIGIDLPTRADMDEIEVSSRLYQKDEGSFMTALLMANTEGDHPVADAVTFVLARQKLVTLRYIDPMPFPSFVARCDRGTVHAFAPEDVLIALLDAIVDRMADLLERIGVEVEGISRQIFEPQGRRGGDAGNFRNILGRLGRQNDMTSKMRECLLTFLRLLSFFLQICDGKNLKDVRSRCKTLSRDIQSLQDHGSHVSSRLNYLLDATLGLINFDQNNIIKIVSVSAMVFLPPTLIASAVALNVKLENLPTLDWALGGPIALGLMIVSAIAPYLWFKRQGWL